MPGRAGRRRADIALLLPVGAATIVLFFLPTGFERPANGSQGGRAKALVLAVDNSTVRQFGPVKEGEQLLSLRLQSGPFRGREAISHNLLMGKMELDKFYSRGDRVLVGIDLDSGGNIAWVNAIEYERFMSGHEARHQDQPYAFARKTAD